MPPLDEVRQFGAAWVRDFKIAGDSFPQMSVQCGQVRCFRKATWQLFNLSYEPTTLRISLHYDGELSCHQRPPTPVVCHIAISDYIMDEDGGSNDSNSCCQCKS